MYAGRGGRGRDGPGSRATARAYCGPEEVALGLLAASRAPTGRWVRRPVTRRAPRTGLGTTQPRCPTGRGAARVGQTARPAASRAPPGERGVGRLPSARPLGSRWPTRGRHRVTEEPRRAPHDAQAVRAVALPVADDGLVAGGAVPDGQRRRRRLRVGHRVGQRPAAVEEDADAVGAVAVPVAGDRGAEQTGRVGGSARVTSRTTTGSASSSVGTGRQQPLRAADDAEVGRAVAVPVAGDRTVARPGRR